MTLLPSKSIEIDEEGYPVFGGLRSQDESLNHECLSHLRLTIEAEPRSPLLTTCANAKVLVHSFDCPLVAQQVEEVGETSALWIFPGDLKHKVFYKDLSQDIWGRLHAFIGEAQIPAVLSRKAQASFLNQVNVETLKISDYWPNASDVDTSKRWQGAYEKGEDRWEMGRASPVLSHYGVPRLLDKSTAEILVPGAGRGHDAQWIFDQGYRTTALDLLETAQKEFHKFYPESKMPYVTGDLFEFMGRHPGAYDGIFEHTIFCAINPSRRQEFLKSVYDCLKHGGVYFGVFFRQTWQGGPPFGLTEWELRELSKDLFDIKVWERTTASDPKRLHRELWAVFQKR